MMSDGRLIIDISIHAPREGGDVVRQGEALLRGLFQSTPPARGATWREVASALDKMISIHAPREGGDFDETICERLAAYISIHAPREGGDGVRVGHRSGADHFNPRPPRGGRLDRAKLAAIQI